MIDFFKTMWKHSNQEDHMRFFALWMGGSLMFVLLFKWLCPPLELWGGLILGAITSLWLTTERIKERMHLEDE